MSVKQFLDVSKIDLGSYELRLAEDELQSKKLLIRELLKTKLKDAMTEYAETHKKDK